MLSRVFFYGLYMDPALLKSLHLHPRVVGAAKLDNYQLRIGRRATLSPASGETAYGFLHDLPTGEVEALYARPEVRGYAPVTVDATLLADDSVHSAGCYVLTDDEVATEPNREYAEKLSAMVLRLGLPAAYADTIAAIAR